MKKYVLAALCLLISSLSFVSVVGASPALCPSSALRWSSTSNTLYIDGASTTCTAADLSTARPNQVVNKGDGIYLVRSNIKITNGATLQAIGATSGGDTNELRLLSNNATSSASFVTIIADWGQVQFNGVKVTSWDEGVNGPSTDISYGRAYIDVRSRYVNGVALQSQMDIQDSEVSYLGYNGSEAYGLVWKVEGSTSTNKSVFNYADVLGNVIGNHLHHNYFGMYTFGAYGMTIDNNEVDHNIKYGIDTHDDSDYLAITNNRTHDNGDHGIICSQRCDHLTITGNDSYNNTGHGIMLHRLTDFCDVENNTVTDNTQAGIALFESNNNIVKNNIIIGNAYGIRLSVGSSYNQFLDNTINGSTSYGVYTYQGSDKPERVGNNGINSYNTWSGNVISHSGSKIMKLKATDHDNFDSNDFRDNPSIGFDLSGATNTKYTNNLTDPGVTLP